MGRLLLIIAAFVIMVGLNESCKKDECTGKITISYVTFEDFGGNDCEIIINEQSKGVNYIIDSQSGLESLVECTSLPDIDFEKYTLLLGSYQSEIDLTYKSQAIIRDCETQTLTFRISYDSEQIDTSMLVDYHAIIPKVPEDYEVKFEIQVWKIY